MLIPPERAVKNRWATTPGDENRFWAVLYDHYPADLESQDQGANLPIDLQVRNLPKEANAARVTVYRVDRDHGSVFTLTESKEFIARRAQATAQNPLIYTDEEIAALREKARFMPDEDFKGNGDRFPVRNGALDLELTLGTNRVLMVELDWGTERSPK